MEVSAHRSKIAVEVVLEVQVDLLVEGLVDKAALVEEILELRTLGLQETLLAVQEQAEEVAAALVAFME